MSRRVGTPMNKVVLSSVNVVRLQRGGGRFEVACYPNKVVDYRSGTETDLDEVLQIRTVFKNVSKGVATPKKDLAKVFPRMSVDDVCREILRSGQLQVSARERGAASEALIRDVAGIVVVAQQRIRRAVDVRVVRPYQLLDRVAVSHRRRASPRSSRRRRPFRRPREPGCSACDDPRRKPRIRAHGAAPAPPR